MAKNIPEEWSQHLTPELRKHFGNIGRELVENNIANHKYGTMGKHFAALAWLAEQRQEGGRKDSARFWLLFTVGVLTLFIALLGLAVTKGVL